MALLHWAMSVFKGDSGGMRRPHVRPVPVASSAFQGIRFPPEVIVLAGALVPTVRALLS